MVTITIDDCRVDTYEVARPLLLLYGLPAVPAAVTGITGDVPGAYMSWGQLQELEAAGWEIASHSVHHPQMSKMPLTYGDEGMTGWALTPDQVNTYQYVYTGNQRDYVSWVTEDGTRLTWRYSVVDVEANPGSWFVDSANDTIYAHCLGSDDPSGHTMKTDSAERELEESQQAMVAHGLAGQSFIVPTSAWNTALASLALSYYGQVGGGLKEANRRPPNLGWLHRTAVKTEDSVADVMAYVEEAIRLGAWSILMFHYFGESQAQYYWTVGKLEELCAEIEALVTAGKLEVVTLAEGVAAWAGQGHINLAEDALQAVTSGLDSGRFLNLVENGSFEYDRAGWRESLGSGTIEFDTDSPYHGQQSMKATPSGGYVTVQGTHLPVEPDTEYTFSCWYKFTKATGGSLRVYLDATWHTIASSTVGEWTRYTKSFITGAGTSEIRVNVQVAANGSVGWFDGVQLEVGGTAHDFEEYAGAAYKQYRLSVRYNDASREYEVAAWRHWGQVVEPASVWAQVQEIPIQAEA